jgi:hypothetical protein
MSYVYIDSEPGLKTVGFYSPDGKWHAESDHSNDEKAAERVAYLNGQSLRHQLADATRKLEEARKDDCAWTDSGDDNMPGTYEGKCGIVWTFTEGGIADNDCIYCPRCGGKIIDQPIEQGNGGDDVN